MSLSFLKNQNAAVCILSESEWKFDDELLANCFLFHANVDRSLSHKIIRIFTKKKTLYDFSTTCNNYTIFKPTTSIIRPQDFIGWIWALYSSWLQTLKSTAFIEAFNDWTRLLYSSWTNGDWTQLYNISMERFWSCIC